VPAKRGILIVDDHAVFREGLAKILEQEKDLAVCGQAEDGACALKQAQSLSPEMAIIDISLDGMNGLDLTRMLRAKYPALRILILSMHKEFLYAERALHAGANGYVMKQESGRTLMAAVHDVLSGKTYLSESVRQWMAQTDRTEENPTDASGVARLTNRELEVFQLIARGYGTRQIADALSVSMKTVETHREHIREKLHLKTTFDLIQYALAWATHS